MIAGEALRPATGAALKLVRDGCWGWLLANRTAFRLFPGEAAALRGPRLKANAELMIFVTACVRRGLQCDALPPLTEFLTASLDGFDWESQLARDPHFVVAVLTVVEYLDAIGHDASAMRRLVERVLELDAVRTLAIAPYRRMEIERLLVRAGFVAADRAAFVQRYRECTELLAKPPSHFTLQDAYALTHLICYLCDDGARDPRELIAAGDVERLKWLTGTFGRLALIDRNADLLAEIVMCDRFLGVGDAWLRSAALELAVARLEPSGSIACGPEADRFFDRYHSTLLWAYVSLAFYDVGVGDAECAR
jgi:hypothetical protein